MGLHKLFHDIVTQLPIHEGVKADLHKQVDENVEKDDTDGTEPVDGTSGPDSSSGK
jgi:hypothetical protein